MKKIISAFLAAALIASLAGCFPPSRATTSGPAHQGPPPRQDHDRGPYRQSGPAQQPAGQPDRQGKEPSIQYRGHGPARAPEHTAAPGPNGNRYQQRR